MSAKSTPDVRPSPDAVVPPLLTAAEASSSGDPLLALEAHVLGAVVALVPASAALFITFTTRRAIKRAVSLVDLELQLDLDALWARYAAAVFRTDPFTTALSDSIGATVLSLAQVEQRGRAYADYLRDVGWVDRMVMYLAGSGRVFGMVSLLRTAQQGRFTPGDANALRRIHSLVEHAYVAAVAPSAASGSPADRLRESGLTQREAEVAELVGRGATNAEIARALHISMPTVKTHLSHIYAKVGVQSRTGLAILAGGNPGDN